MVDPGTIIAGAGLVHGIIRGGRKRPNARRAIAELRAAKPTGYLLPEDYRHGELVKGRLAEGARRQGELAEYDISRRYTARGLHGSPSEERTRGRVAQQTALGVQQAGEEAEEQLYGIRTGRESFEREKELRIFGVQAGEAAREEARRDAQDAAYWNSLYEFLPTILSYLPGDGTTAPPGATTSAATPTSGYNPSGGAGTRPRRSPPPPMPAGY